VEVYDVSSGELVFKSDPEVSDFAWGSDARTLLLGGKRVTIR
jgi:hypothetical protein